MSHSFRGRFFALHNARRFSPAPPRHCARIVPVFVPTKPLARRRGVLGRRSRFSTALQPPLPRRGACAIIVPTWRLNCRCPSARRRWRWAVRLRNGFSVGTGATRSAKPPKSERGVFRLSRLAEKQPRSLSRLRRASPPPLGRHPALVRQSAAFKTETRKVPRLSAALLGSIRVCNVGRVGTRQKWRGARRCRGV